MAALTNPTVCVLAGAVLVLFVAGGRPAAEVLAAYARWLRRPVVLGLLAALVALHVGARIALGLIAPGDFSAEIVAARSEARGEGLYAANLGDEARALQGDTPDTWTTRVMASMPESLRAGVEARRHARIAAQAHPPTLLLAFVPLIGWLGAGWAFACLALGSIVAAAWTARRVTAVLGSSADLGLLAGWLAVGWQPVLAALRDGQVSVLVSALALGAWLAARDRKNARAGALLGTASAFKVYPVLLLIPLALRSRVAVAVGLLTVGAMLLATTALVPAGTWGAYLAAARDVFDAHWRTWANLSVLARLGQFASKPVATMLWVGTGALLVLVTLWVGSTRGLDGGEAGSSDISFARFSCLAVMLSPVAWHHYVFLLVLPLGLAWRAAVATGRRSPIVAVLAAALMLSLPVADTSGMWTAAPPGRLLGLALSPTTAVFALWLWLVRARPAIGGPPALV